MTTGVGPGRRRLREHLLASGAMTPDWVPAYDAVPRELFLPEVMWPSVEGQRIVVSRADGPAEWLRWADADVPITTQWDDGRHDGPERGELATSSSSMPGVVFDILRELSVFDGARALEVGTGTGWCAALLSARLGEDNVASIEIDEAVAKTARTVPAHPVHARAFPARRMAPPSRLPAQRPARRHPRVHHLAHLSRRPVR